MNTTGALKIGIQGRFSLGGLKSSPYQALPTGPYRIVLSQPDNETILECCETRRRCAVRTRNLINHLGAIDRESPVLLNEGSVVKV